MRLDRQFILHTFRSFALLASIFFPILYLSDFLFVEGFKPLYALTKLLFRYGQSLASLLLWSVWMAVRRLRKRYSDVSFITMGFRPKDGWRVIMILSIFFAMLDAFIFIPSNNLFFSKELIITNWSIYNIDNKEKNKDANSFFLHKIGEKIELWQTKPYVNFANGYIKNNVAHIEKFDEFGNKMDLKLTLDKDDFFILWNEPKKLSWSGLRDCKRYLLKHNLSTLDLSIQFQIFLSRIFLLFPMVLFGFALGWKNGVNAMIACCIFSNWLNQIVIFMPFSWATICVWSDVVLWLILGAWYLI